MSVLGTSGIPIRLHPLPRLRDLGARLVLARRGTRPDCSYSRSWVAMSSLGFGLSDNAGSERQRNGKMERQETVEICTL
jgi:hypothetical protein